MDWRDRTYFMSIILTIWHNDINSLGFTKDVLRYENYSPLWAVAIAIIHKRDRDMLQ